MRDSVGLKELVECMSQFLDKHGDMPVAFHDVKGNFHEIVGQSLGTLLDAEDKKMFVLRGYETDNKPAGVRVGKAKNI